jgi:uncharacterized Zn finger protein (UPF0148 family)
MISKGEFIDYVVSHNLFTYDKDRNVLTDKENREFDADSFLDAYRKKTGQSFECLYDEHVSCFDILKCTECGTVIFEHYDEDYEPGLKCPVCTDYKTGFKYYTMLNIIEDENKKKEIDMYLEFARIQREADERYEKRGGLYDFQKTHRKTLFNGKKYKVDIQLTGFSKWDLEAEINIWKKKDDISLVCKHHIKIPISPTTIWFYIKHKVKLKVTWENV